MHNHCDDHSHPTLLGTILPRTLPGRGYVSYGPGSHILSLNHEVSNPQEV